MGDATWPGFTLDGSDHDYTGGTTINGSGTTLTLNGTIDTGVVMTGGANFRINKAGAQSLVLGGAISGTGNVMTSGNFTFDNDANSWQGSLRTIADFPGMIKFTSIGNVGGGPSALGNPQNAAQGTILLTGGTGGLEYLGSGDSTDRIIQLSGFTDGGWSKTISASGSTTTASPFEITSNLGGSGTSWFYLGGTGAGVWSGAIGTVPKNGFAKIDSGTWTLLGANTYTVRTEVQGGTLAVGTLDVVANPNPLGMSSADAANLRLNNSTTLKYLGGAGTTDRLFTINGASAGHGVTLDASGTGPVSFTNTGALAYGSANQTRTLTLAGTNTGNNSLAASIGNNGTGAVSVVKSGPGTWVLSGSSGYTGATTVSGGKLVIGPTGSINSTSGISIGAGKFFYNNAATALGIAPTFSAIGGTLGGIGTITPAITITNGNVLAPGDGGGTLIFNGGLTLNTGAIVEITHPGTSLAQVNGNYTDSLGAHTLLVTGATAPGTPYTFLQWTGSSGVLNGPQSNWEVTGGSGGSGTTKNWIGAVSANWNTAASWDGYSGSVTANTAAKTLSFTTATGGVPTSVNDVVINPTASGIVVTGPASGPVGIKSLQVGGSNNTSPTLTLGAADFHVAGPVNVVSNGTLNAVAGGLVAPTLNVSSPAAAATLGSASGNVATANVSAGTLTVNAGTVATANLSGTGHLAGTGAVTQVNVTGGTPTFSGNATVLTLPDGTTGAVTFAAGARAATADFSAGAGIANASATPLAISSALKLPERVTATYTPGGSATAFTAAGANLVNNAEARTLSLSGGTLTLSAPGVPATTGINYFQITGDSDARISLADNVTHAIDWGTSGVATVNGVAFASDVNVSAGGRTNAGTRTYGSAGAHGGNTPPAVSGSVASVFQDMVYGGPDPGYIELTGLTPGQWYDVRLYDRAWDYNGATRTFYAVYDVGSDGSLEFTTPTIDQNRGHLTPPGMSGNVSWATSYIYQADSSGKMKVIIDLAPGQSGTYHLYGLSNQVVPVPPASVSLPATSIAVTAPSTLDLAVATLDHTLGLTLSADLAIQNARSVSLAELRGNGNVTGNLAVRELLSPGSSLGTIGVVGDLTLAAGVLYDWELGDVASSDRVEVGGILTLDDWTLRLLQTDGTASASDKFYVFAGDSSGWGPWTPTGIPGDFIDASLITNPDWNVSGAYLGMDQGGIFLSGLVTTSLIVPEPSTFVLLGLGIAGLMGYAWRRRRGH